jgi:hypothetical protein
LPRLPENSQRRQPLELRRVRRHQRQATGSANGADFQVVGANDEAGSFEVMTDVGVMPGGIVVEGEGHKRREQLVQRRPTAVATGVATWVKTTSRSREILGDRFRVFD